MEEFIDGRNPAPGDDHLLGRSRRGEGQCRASFVSFCGRDLRVVPSLFLLNKTWRQGLIVSLLLPTSRWGLLP